MPRRSAIAETDELETAATEEEIAAALTGTVFRHGAKTAFRGLLLFFGRPVSRRAHVDPVAVQLYADFGIALWNEE